jgi:hypothetical protein
MSDAVVIAIIVAVPPTLVALGALLVGLRNTRKVDDAKVAAEQGTAKIVEVGGQVFELGKAVDGRLQTLLEKTEQAAAAAGKAAGMLEGAQQEREKQDDERQARQAGAAAGHAAGFAHGVTDERSHSIDERSNIQRPAGMDEQPGDIG